jgi:hypothetical protein
MSLLSEENPTLGLPWPIPLLLTRCGVRQEAGKE